MGKPNELKFFCNRIYEYINKKIIPHIVPQGAQWPALITVFVLIGVWIKYRWSDMLLITGLAAFALGLLMVEQIPHRYRIAFNLMRAHRVLKLNKTNNNIVEDYIKSAQKQWSMILTLVCAVAMLIAFILASCQGYPLSKRVLLVFFEVAGAAIAGFYIGHTIIAYGSFGIALKKEREKLLREANNDNDNLYSKILEIENRLNDSLEHKNYNDWLYHKYLKKKLQERCLVIERTPTWPFDVRPKIVFFSSIALDLVSLISGLVTIMGVAESSYETIRNRNIMPSEVVNQQTD